jgi:hypothetical protein
LTGLRLVDGCRGSKSRRLLTGGSLVFGVLAPQNHPRCEPCSLFAADVLGSGLDSNRGDDDGVGELQAAERWKWRKWLSWSILRLRGRTSSALGLLTGSSPGRLPPPWPPVRVGGSGGPGSYQRNLENLPLPAAILPSKPRRQVPLAMPRSSLDVAARTGQANEAQSTLDSHVSNRIHSLSGDPTAKGS